MQRTVIFLFCLTLTISSNAAQKVMSHEESVVRKTYAKLSFAAQLGSIHRSLSKQIKNANPSSMDTDLSRSELRFELKNFATGKLTDIANRSYANLVTKPTGGEALDISTGTFKYTSDDVNSTLEADAKAHWTQAQDLSQQNWDVPVSQAIAAIDDRASYDRYAAYTATVYFEGRSKTYSALFLFGRDKSTDREIVLAIDLVAGNSAVGHFVDHSVYPAALLETNLRSNPAVSKWLNENNDASCKSDAKEPCCNPKTMTCSIAAGDVQAKPSRPTTKLALPKKFRPSPESSDPLLLRTTLRLPKLHAFLGVCEDGSYSTGPYPYGVIGTNEHINGAHNFAAGFWGSCDFSGDPGQCYPFATANAGGDITDNGGISTLGFSCHVVNHNEMNGIAEGGTAPSATSVAAAGVRGPD
jgi:hypothetical protein